MSTTDESHRRRTITSVLTTALLLVTLTGCVEGGQPCTGTVIDKQATFSGKVWFYKVEVKNTSGQHRFRVDRTTYAATVRGKAWRGSRGCSDG